MLVHIWDDAVLDTTTILVPGGSVLVLADGAIPAFSVHKQDEEIDGVEVRQDAREP